MVATILAAYGAGTADQVMVGLAAVLAGIVAGVLYAAGARDHRAAFGGFVLGGVAAVLAIGLVYEIGNVLLVGPVVATRITALLLACYAALFALYFEGERRKEEKDIGP